MRTLSPFHARLCLTVAVVASFFFANATFAACDPKGLDVCVVWAEKQIQALGCHADSATFPHVVEDLYLGTGCRIQGTSWTKLPSGSAVKGRFENGVNTDSAGCIARYTPGAYLSSGGYFRTPKESMNGSLRNKNISGCEYNSDLGKKDASELTSPIMGGIMSCSCAGAVSGAAVVVALKPTPAAGGATSQTKPDNSCSANKVMSGGECVCKEGFREFADLSCAIECPTDGHFTRKSTTECGCAQLYRLSDDKKECVFSPEKGFTFDVDSREKFQEAVEKLGPNEGTFLEGTLANGKSFRVGILRLSNGKYVFTNDGQHFFEDPRKAIATGVLTKIGEGLDNAWRGLGRLFGIGKFSGKGTGGEEGKQEQEDGQRRLDAATQAQKQLEDDLGDPAKRADTAAGIGKQWAKRMKNGVDGDDKQFLKDMQDATGVDAGMIRKALTGDTRGVQDDVINKLVDGLKKQTGLDPRMIKMALAGDTAGVHADALDQLAKAFKEKTGLDQESIKKALKGDYSGLRGNAVDTFFNAVKQESGVDVPVIRQAFKGDFAGIASGITEKLTTFPADSVVILAKELRSSSFGNAVRVYIAEREGGKSAADLGSNPTPELDYVTNVQGVSQQYVRGGLFAAYEEAYQRYRIASSFK